MPNLPANPTFRKVLRGASKGEILVPVLRSYLYDPKFPSFEIQIGAFKEREYDGYFHPSQHPLWPERMLYYYLTDHTRLVKEPFDPSSTMALTQGNFWHKFFQHCLTDAGLISHVEFVVGDEETGARGSIDGVVFEKVLDFKTMHPAKIAKVTTVQDFIEVFPDYYYQFQEYMRLSGYREVIMLALALIYPFEMRELIIPYDPVAALGVRDKYLRVRQAVADQIFPMPCCSPRSKQAKSCPARLICPIGVL